MTSLLCLLDRLGRRLICFAVGHDWGRVYDGSELGSYEACRNCDAFMRRSR